MPLCKLRPIQPAKLRGLRNALSVPLLAMMLTGLAVSSSFATPPPPPEVVVTPGSLAGADLGDGDSVTTASIRCSAVANHGPVTNDEIDVDGPHWSWGASAAFLDDGQTPHDPSATGSASVDLHPGSPDTNSDCDYTVTFDSPGDYVITLTATATYYETIKTGPHAGEKSTVTMSGDGNPGVDDSDAAPPASPNAIVPYAGNAPTPPKAPAKISSVSGFRRPGVYLMIGKDVESPSWVGCGTSSPSFGPSSSVNSGPKLKVLGTTYVSVRDRQIGHIIEKRLDYQVGYYTLTKINVHLLETGDVHAIAGAYAAKNGVQMYSVGKGCARRKTDYSLTVGAVSVTVGCTGPDEANAQVSTAYPEYDNQRATHSPNERTIFKLSVTGASACETSSGYMSEASASAGVSAYAISAAFKFEPGR